MAQLDEHLLRDRVRSGGQATGRLDQRDLQAADVGAEDGEPDKVRDQEVVQTRSVPVHLLALQGPGELRGRPRIFVSP